MAALDRGLRADVQKELTGIQRKVGTTFVLVTHDQDEAMAMSDYIAVMDQGDIVQFGTPREVYEFPRTRFVASFLGTINLFECGRVERFPSHCQVTTEDGLTITASCNADSSIEPGHAVGVRPEKISIARGPSASANNFAGVIERLSYCGNLSHATVRLAGGRAVEATVVNSDHTGADALAPGAAVYVAFPPEAAVALRT
jgi:putrescine transport system ATP-binding protein